MRKPKPEGNANEMLNSFCKENGIVLGLNKSSVDFTNSGQLIIGRPDIVAVFAKNIPQQPQDHKGKN